MSIEQSLTHWTAQGAFLLYVSALVVWSRAQLKGRLRLARGLWTFAFVLMLVHVMLAFQSFHHWSHQAAYEDTARQTVELTGLRWGGGIYANYVLLLVWLVDVIWWWRGLASYEARPKIVVWCIQGFLAFMWFNATVVFGHEWIRWAGLVGFVVLAIAFRQSRSGAKREADGH